jgi:Suppressor of fused protein (SUFU)
LCEAPADLDRTRMMAGSPPANPRTYCRTPQPQPLPSAESLRFVWLPEGNGVALYEADDLLAIIPPWSGVKGFDGYARDAVGTGPLAWELSAENVLRERFAKADEYWQLWDGNLWPRVQAELIERLEAAFGPQVKYYAIDGGNWPPKALVRFSTDDAVVLISIGVSLRPQPAVEMGTDTPEKLRRIEIGAVLPKTWPETAIKKFGAYLSGQSNLPWSKYTWFGAGHTIPCDSWQNSKFTSALLCDRHPAIPQLDLGMQFGDPVNLLWFLPITEPELQIAMNTSSAALLAKLPATRWQQA